MAVQNSVRSFIGIAKEVTKGTAVAPTSFIPVSASSLKPVNIVDPLYDKGLRGSLVDSYAYIPGRTRSTFDFGGDVFPDTIGFPIAGVLGTVSTTGSSAPYTHAITLKNSLSSGADAQPISYTITDFSAADVRAFSALQFHDFTLNFSADGLLAYEAKATGFLSATASAPTPSFSSVLPTPVWQGTVSVGGSAISNTTTGSLTMSRTITPIYGIAQTQNPYSVFLGALTTTGSFTFVMENNTQLLNYLNNTQPAIVLNWAYGAGASAVQLQATITKGAYTTAANDRSADYVTITCEINGQGNTTDAGAVGYGNVKWTLVNAETSGTYA